MSDKVPTQEEINKAEDNLKRAFDAQRKAQLDAQEMQNIANQKYAAELDAKSAALKPEWDKIIKHAEELYRGKQFGYETFQSAMSEVVAFGYDIMEVVNKQPMLPVLKSILRNNFSIDVDAQSKPTERHLTKLEPVLDVDQDGRVFINKIIMDKGQKATEAEKRALLAFACSWLKSHGYTMDDETRVMSDAQTGQQLTSDKLRNLNQGNNGFINVLKGVLEQRINAPIEQATPADLEQDNNTPRPRF
jgi:membrane-associated HD superfamily phosphohydrolase